MPCDRGFCGLRCAEAPRSPWGVAWFDGVVQCAAWRASHYASVACVVLVDVLVAVVIIAVWCSR